jgi:hypothetical protein
LDFPPENRYPEHSCVFVWQLLPVLFFGHPSVSFTWSSMYIIPTYYAHIFQNSPHMISPFGN